MAEEKKNKQKKTIALENAIALGQKVSNVYVSQKWVSFGKNKTGVNLRLKTSQ